MMPASCRMRIDGRVVAPAAGSSPSSSDARFFGLSDSKPTTRRRAAALLHQPHQLRIARDVDARPGRTSGSCSGISALNSPSPSARRRRCCRRRRRCAGARRARSRRPLRATGRWRRFDAVKRADRAEVAVVAAAATVLHQRHRRVALAAEDAAIGHAGRRAARIRPAGRRCCRRPRARVLDDARPDALGIADHDRIGESQRLVGQERRMIAAHDDRHAARADTRRRSGRRAARCRSPRSSPRGRWARRAGSASSRSS